MFVPYEQWLPFINDQKTKLHLMIERLNGLKIFSFQFFFVVSIHCFNFYFPVICFNALRLVSKYDLCDALSVVNIFFYLIQRGRRLHLLKFWKGYIRSIVFQPLLCMAVPQLNRIHAFVQYQKYSRNNNNNNDKNNSNIINNKYETYTSNQLTLSDCTNKQTINN